MGSIEGTYFCDDNNNSVLDSEDILVGGQTVSLFNATTGALVATTMTSTEASTLGTYSFNDVIPGDYTVQFGNTTGLAFAEQDFGTDDTVDSDVNSTGSVSVSVAAGDHVANVDAGLDPVDTLEEVKDLLPETATMEVINHARGDNPTDEAYTAIISDGNDLINGTFVDAYCLNLFRDIEFATSTDDTGDSNNDGIPDWTTVAPDVGANVTLATEDCLNPQQQSLISSAFGTNFKGVNDKSAVENLDLINWIINQDYKNTDNGDGTGETYTDNEIQGAIWALTSGDVFSLFNVNLAPGLSERDGIAMYGGSPAGFDNAQEIVNAAIANGEGFEADASNGDLVGVFLEPTTDPNEQPFLVVMDLYEEC